MASTQSQRRSSLTPLFAPPSHMQEPPLSTSSNCRKPSPLVIPGIWSKGSFSPTSSQLTPPLTPQTFTGSAVSTTDTEFESVHNYVRAFYHYVPSNSATGSDDESSITIPISRGDVILVHSVQPNGWADGTILMSGARGWIPTNYCEPYNHEAICSLLNAMTYVWEFIRGHEDDDPKVFCSQDYVRGMIAGIRIFLARSGCLNRDSPLIKGHAGLRRARKGILGDLSSYVKATKQLQELCQHELDMDMLYSLLDDIVLKAFKTVIRAVKFLDITTQDLSVKLEVDGNNIESHQIAPQLTPPSECHATFSADIQTIDSHLEPETVSTPHDVATDTTSGPEATQVSAVQTTLPAAQTADEPHASRTQEATEIELGQHLLNSQKRPSTSLQSSRSSQTPITSHKIFASKRLCAAHDQFLVILKAFISPNPQLHSAMELRDTTQCSIEACRSLLAVVEEVWQRDLCRSAAITEARQNMHLKLTELVNAAQEIVLASEGGPINEASLPIQGKRLVDAATLCVQSASDCVSKTNVVVERIGDFDFGPSVFGSFNVTNTGALETAIPSQEAPRPRRASSAAVTQRVSKPSTPALPHIPQPEHEPPLPPIVTTFSSLPATDKETKSEYIAPVRLSIRSSSLPRGIKPRASVDTVVWQNPRSSNRISTFTLTKPNYRPLDIDIPHTSFIDMSESPSTPNYGQRMSDRTGSATESIIDGGHAYLGSFQYTEAPPSQASTRATTPERCSPKTKGSQESIGSLSGSQTLPGSSDDAETQSLKPTYAHELIHNKGGQVAGGSLRALVERLTPRPHTSEPCMVYQTAFHLTFRLFTTPAQLARALIDRFDYAGEDEEFTREIRLQVYDVITRWLQSYWRSETDMEALTIISDFASTKLQDNIPLAAQKLMDLTTSLADVPAAQFSPITGKAWEFAGNSTADTTKPNAPNPAVSKGQLNLLKRFKTGGLQSCTILDLDPLEVARQFTLIESKIFCAIQPEELLSLEWMKKEESKAVHVRKMSSLSTDLANLVADTILQLEIKKRAMVIKQWVKIAKACLELNNYDSLMAIICALNSSMVQRLEKTWELVSPKTMTKFKNLVSIVHSDGNSRILRQRLKAHCAPCLPFVGMYLTDLNAVHEGNPDTRELSNDSSVQGINFFKFATTAKIIMDLQRFQVPYNLTAVPDMQDWIMAQIGRVRDSDEANAQNYRDRSMMLEPKISLPVSTVTSFIKNAREKEAREREARDSEAREKQVRATSRELKVKTKDINNAVEFNFWNGGLQFGGVK